MNKSIIYGILISVVVVIVGSVLFGPDNTSSPAKSVPVYDSGFTYYDIELIQTTLSEQNIVVSTPTAITDHTITEYCTYFKNGLPQTVEYCTTTAVLDSEGNPLGNINLGGDVNSPVMAVANLETSSIDENQEEVVAVFEVVIESLVCDCWEEKSSDFESIPAWLDTARTFYVDSGERNVKSQIDNLGNTKLLLEITSEDDSVLQTLIILK